MSTCSRARNLAQRSIRRLHGAHACVKSSVGASSCHRAVSSSHDPRLRSNMRGRLPAWTCLHARSSGGLSINWGMPLQTEGPVTPVTLLGGFLGAGKTTLLKKLLENRRGLRVGVIVNDVASVNVDAQLITSKVVGDDGVEVAELQNGCVCCSLADDLLMSVAEVLARAPEGSAFDHLIIELSGVSEPKAIKQNWTMAREIGHPVALRSDIACVVTVVDASCFGTDWLDERSALDRNEKFQENMADSRRSIVELLAEQIETADTILLNKVDLAGQAEVSTAKNMIASLNSSASFLSTSFGDVDPSVLLPNYAHGSSASSTASEDRASRPCAHGHAHGDGHGHGHGHSHGHSHNETPQEKYGIHSFVYVARRPFIAERFNKFVEQIRDGHPLRHVGEGWKPNESALRGLLRAKGTCWLDGEPLFEHTWSFAGRSFSLEKGEPWWDACSEQQLQWRIAYPGVDKIYERVRRDAWDAVGEWGDRRQELVFIGGPEMDEAQMRAALDKCLLTPLEMDEFRERYLGKTALFELNLGPGVSLFA